MQILSIWKGFEEYECKFEPFERDSKHSNAYSKGFYHSNANFNYLNDIWNIRIQIVAIRTIRTNLKHSNANSNHSNQIRMIWKRFKMFECKFEPFKPNSKHLNANLKIIRIHNSKRVRSVQMQILTIRTRFKAFECKFKPFERDSKHSNAYSNHLNEIRSIQMHILTIWMRFEAFKCNFIIENWV